MKKYLLFLLTLSTVLSLCAGCGNKNTDKPNTSEEAIASQEQGSSEGSSSNEDASSASLPDEEDGSLEGAETTEEPVSSEDAGLDFTKEDALAYFDFEYNYEYFADFTPVAETARIPFSELEKWLDGTSDLKTPSTYGGEEVSIYELFDAELFHKPFTETDFYTIRIRGRSMNVQNNGVDCSKPVGDDWTEENGGVWYGIRYNLEDVTVSMHVARLSEYNKHYQATLGTISDCWAAMGRDFKSENIQTVKMYNQITDEYIDVEVYVDENDGNGIKYINFIFNRYVFTIDFFKSKKAIELDDILDDIVIMDLREAYNKIK